jgi:hypothetical protein
LVCIQCVLYLFFRLQGLFPVACECRGPSTFQNVCSART